MGNLRVPQTLFRGAALLQTKKFQNNEYSINQSINQVYFRQKRPQNYTKSRLKTVNVNYLVLKCDT